MSKKVTSPKGAVDLATLVDQADAGSISALFVLAKCYEQGMFSLPRDPDKALELYHRAARGGWTPAMARLQEMYDANDTNADPAKEFKMFQLQLVYSRVTRDPLYADTGEMIQSIAPVYRSERNGKKYAAQPLGNVVLFANLGR